MPTIHDIDFRCAGCVAIAPHSNWPMCAVDEQIEIETETERERRTISNVSFIIIPYPDRCAYTNLVFLCVKNNNTILWAIVVITRLPLSTTNCIFCHHQMAWAWAVCTFLRVHALCVRFNEGRQKQFETKRNNICDFPFSNTENARKWCECIVKARGNDEIKITFRCHKFE